MELFSPGHLIPLLIVVAVLFFGWKQLPDMARSAGRSLRLFKTEMKGMAEDDEARASQQTTPPAVEAPAAAPAPAEPAAAPAAPAAPTAPVAQGAQTAQAQPDSPRPSAE